MATEVNLNIWVTRLEVVNGEPIAEGISFDGAFGFGDDDLRSYEGEVVLLSADGREETFAEVTMFHLSGRGLLWNLRVENPPAVPFLVSSDLKLRGPVRVALDLQPSVEAHRVFSTGSRNSYPVRADGVFGLLTSDDSGVSLIMFSEGVVSPGDELGLSFADWDVLLGVGTIL